jgi:hypothetical protein
MRIPSFPRDLTPEDRITEAKWVRCLAISSGCAVLLLLGLLIALGTPGDDFDGAAAGAAGIGVPAKSNPPSR